MIFSVDKRETNFLRLLTASILTSFSKSLRSVEKIEKREVSEISVPRAEASSAKFFAR